MKDKKNIKKEYKINIDPRILELLGPNLYTNIYYVLAELIANSYDAGANNVYIIEEDNKIIVEDDGSGMSYNNGDIEKYLSVATETRTDPSQSIVKGTKRKKMGRKGIGKLAALSVSENVNVLTVKDSEKSGFVLSRHVGEDHKLKPLDNNEVMFNHINQQGTSVIMKDPEYGLHKTIDAIKRNLLRIFPIVNDDFKIHIIRDKKKIVLDSFEKEIIQDLGALITIGDSFKHLSGSFSPGFNKDSLLVQKDDWKQNINLKNRFKENKDYELVLNGWIGAYKTTRGRKNSSDDFPDNFISLLSNGKLGEFNILPLVGKNRLNEVFVVGQLHIDLFEETELPDMSLSNRQGYKSDDPRYSKVIHYIREFLLPEILKLRSKYVKLKNNESEIAKLNRLKAEELKLTSELDDYKTITTNNLTSKLNINLNTNKESIKNIIRNELNKASSLIGLKKTIDSQKKRILISQTRQDKPLADIIQKMLLFNGVPAEDIIYTNSDDEKCWIPDGTEVFDYLRDFFVNSVSTQKIFVIYVTSKNMGTSWGAISEVGAGWITQSDHRIFNLDSFTPQQPLNTGLEWHNSSRNGTNIEMDVLNFKKFIQKIIDICNNLNYSSQSSTLNQTELSRYVNII